jgi:hypothetical protein
MSLSNLTSQLASACNFCDLRLQINEEPPTETPTETPTEDPTEDPTAEPTDSPLNKLINTRINAAAKADPTWCCGQGSPALSAEENHSDNVSALTNAGIDPDNCHECCGKAPEDYWWSQNEICPNSKCSLLYFKENGILKGYYIFNTHNSNVPTVELNVVHNGKLIADFPFLQHWSVEEGNGRRKFLIPNGSKPCFYTGGNTLS